MLYACVFVCACVCACGYATSCGQGLVLAIKPSLDSCSTPTDPRHLAYARVPPLRHPYTLALNTTLAGASAHTAASLDCSASSFTAHAAAASSPCRW